MPLVSYNRLQIIGLIGTAQSWSVGLNFGTTAGEATFDDDTGLGDWLTAIKALNGGSIVPQFLREAMGPGFTITALKASTISGDTGKEAFQARLELGTPISGLGTVTMSQETAVACSLLTGRPGRQYRGRLYWPASGLSLGSDLRFETDECSSMASTMAVFIENLRDASDLSGQAGDPPAGGTFQPLVVSGKGSHVQPITQVAVGDVPDVQRRRRDKEQEVYQVTAIA